MSAARRPCIEVDTGASGRTSDPIKLFAHMVRLRYGGTEEVEEYNRRLLESLMQRGQIPKSSIVWHDEKVSKIYGFRAGPSGKIEYDSPSKGSPKRVAKAHVAPEAPPPIDVITLRDAILVSKQMAI